MLYAIAALNGAAVMVLENVMIRITNLTLGSSSYSFSLLVGVFVLSLAGGSFAVGGPAAAAARTAVRHADGGARAVVAAVCDVG